MLAGDGNKGKKMHKLMYLKTRLEKNAQISNLAYNSL